MPQYRLFRIDTKLSRKSTPQGLPSWGISFSLVDGKYLTVAKVTTKNFSSNQQHVSTLTAGDCILQINGLDLKIGANKTFSTFQSLVDYLARAPQLTIVALRNITAMKQALGILSNNYNDITFASIAACRFILIAIQAIRAHAWTCTGLLPSQRARYKASGDVLPIRIPFEVSTQGIERVMALYTKMYHHSTTDGKSHTKLTSSTYVPYQVKKSPKFINPLMNDEYIDNSIQETDPDDGTRCEMFLLRVTRIDEWFRRRKSKWRSKWRHVPAQSQISFSLPYMNEYSWQNIHLDLRCLKNELYDEGFSDNLDDGNIFEGRLELFLPKIKSFSDWLKDRKENWRQNFTSCVTPDSENVYPIIFEHDFRLITNELYGKGFCDNLDDFSTDEGNATHFLPKIEHFPEWLNKRKEKWNERRTIHYFDEPSSASLSDFWHDYGFSSFDDWLCDIKINWRSSYSWQRQKRKRIEMEVSGEVQFPSDCYSETAERELLRWLVVRKHQWLIARRKRRRKLMSRGWITDRAEGTHWEYSNENFNAMLNPQDVTDPFKLTNRMHQFAPSSPRSVLLKHHLSLISSDPDIQQIDALLEEEERKEMEIKQKISNVPPFDISFIFDPSLCPDEVIAAIFLFLPLSEHGKMMCISSRSSKLIKKRSYMWHSLCPNHWVLPKRPRKSWAQLYIYKLREEEEKTRKISDDILVRASTIIAKRDNLQGIDKIVTNAEKRFQRFSIDYSSAVVLERSSLLNLAVMNSRHKIVKWLIETKGADIETCDRGGFTPLVNAAYNGDRAMVRYLLSKGCNRAKIGTEHSSQALAPIGFNGLNAEGWARKREFDRIADMIKYGL